MAPKTKSSLRWIDLSEAEKKEVIRIRNVQNCKKNRKKWKQSDEEIQQLYESNENRIKQLEKLVEQFSKELEGHSSSSSSSGKKSR